ncbi:hypothetical protein [Streptomyces inusitatus]|uniref:hypothetical protein n=1 Tax=Streptomyces inusitatus TaxID=68221 RepID=UPI00167C66D1|nr:hypothetical protein [Streptomyces inusitatus]
MSASERESQPRTAHGPRRSAEPSRPPVLTASALPATPPMPSMRDLLASCAAARAVSTPPATPAAPPVRPGLARAEVSRHRAAGRDAA